MAAAAAPPDSFGGEEIRDSISLSLIFPKLIDEISSSSRAHLEEFVLQATEEISHSFTTSWSVSSSSREVL